MRLDVALLAALLHCRCKISRDSVLEGLEILPGYHRLSKSETRKDELFLEREEIGGDERDTGIVTVECSDEGCRCTLRVIFEMDGATREHCAAEGIELVGDESAACLCDELGEDLAFRHNEEFFGTGMEMREDDAAGFHCRESKGDIEPGQGRERLSVGGDELAGGSNDGCAGGRIGEIKGKRAVSACCKDLVAGDSAVGLEEFSDEVGRCIAFLGRQSEDGRGGGEEGEENFGKHLFREEIEMGLFD
jgi:hypothetical protein